MADNASAIAEFFARAFPDDELATIRADFCLRGQLRTFRARSILAFEGDDGTGLALVVTGSVVSLATCPQRGREVVVSAARPGMFLHDFAWHDVGSLPLTLRAATATSLFTVDRTTYAGALRKNATFRSHALAIESTAQRALVERVRQLAFYDVRTRIARLLVSADARGESVETRSLAAAIGTVHDVAWRILREFQDEGVVTLRERSAHVTDRQTLSLVGRLAG